MKKYRSRLIESIIKGAKYFMYGVTESLKTTIEENRKVFKFVKKTVIPCLIVIFIMAHYMPNSNGNEIEKKKLENINRILLTDPATVTKVIEGVAALAAWIALCVGIDIGLTQSQAEELASRKKTEDALKVIVEKIPTEGQAMVAYLGASLETREALLESMALTEFQKTKIREDAKNLTIRDLQNYGILQPLMLNRDAWKAIENKYPFAVGKDLSGNPNPDMPSRNNITHAYGSYYLIGNKNYWKLDTIASNGDIKLIVASDGVQKYNYGWEAYRIKHYYYFQRNGINYCFVGMGDKNLSPNQYIDGSISGTFYGLYKNATKFEELTSTNCISSYNVNTMTSLGVGQKQALDHTAFQLKVKTELMYDIENAGVFKTDLFGYAQWLTNWAWFNLGTYKINNRDITIFENELDKMKAVQNLPVNIKLKETGETQSNYMKRLKTDIETNRQTNIDLTYDPVKDITEVNQTQIDLIPDAPYGTEVPIDPDIPTDPPIDPGTNVKLDFTPLQNFNLANKFPFCIPWDIKNSVGAFLGPAIAPKWTLDFTSLHGGTTYTIDFAMFDKLALVIRWGLLIIFNIGLILKTRNIIRG